MAELYYASGSLRLAGGRRTLGPDVGPQARSWLQLGLSRLPLPAGRRPRHPRHHRPPPPRHLAWPWPWHEQDQDLAALPLTDAPLRARILVFAADTEQAGILADAFAGFVERTGLAGAVEVGARVFTQTGAAITVETSDGASAFGARPWLQVMDECSMWPSTANHRRLASAIQSAVAKVPGGQLVMIGTAGSPVGLGRELWDLAEANPEHWRTVVRPGPSPWWTPEDIAATRASSGSPSGGQSATSRRGGWRRA